MAINLSPKECLVFEDSHSGVYAAKSGGFKVIGVGNHNLIEIADFYEDNLNCIFNLENMKSLFNVEEWSIVQSKFEPETRV